LAGRDAWKANEAVWRLKMAGKPAVAFLSKRLLAATPLDLQRVARLILELNSDQFVVRERATEQLASFGQAAEASLRKALAGCPSPEVRERIASLLSRIRKLSLEESRVLRAIEVLEWVGTPDAKHALTILAAGSEDSRLTVEAKISLERLNKQHLQKQLGGDSLPR
jgi:hypothetical protein